MSSKSNYNSAAARRPLRRAACCGDLILRKTSSERFTDINARLTDEAGSGWQADRSMYLLSTMPPYLAEKSAL